ncbi:hypothetical protein Pcinc_012828 [Petrolisthes cinctipes]|uniref:Uncharacterized protein n=1 Tax=Petrolisthes cinctipes TaxID=88211 RepID=A0AAE1G0F1_PETCI|nr:hypothetical protein Pcinc_012828 [Petrolisthes cinctipes]
MSQVGLQRCCVWMAMMLLLPSAPVEGRDLRLFNSVLISLQRIQANTFTQKEMLDISPGANIALYCTTKCTLLDWCKLWCAYPSTNPSHCLVSSIIFMPTYQETDLTDALTCHTTRPKDLATYADITAGLPGVTYPQRNEQNLVNGFYSYDPNENMATMSKPSERWFILDFGQPKCFQHVIMYAQNNSSAPRRFNNIEVRVGNVKAVTPPGDLSSYDLFGWFLGPAAKGQVVEMKSPKPVCARFVSACKVAGDGQQLQVAHIEVF